MLDQISQNYPGQVARVEWHVASGYPFYNAEALSKFFKYPSEGGSYYYGTLYADGKSQYRNYSSWPAYVAARMLVPSDVSLTHVGTTYDPGTRAGQVQVECHNAGSVPISAALQFAITEDSLNYTGPNGDPWHNGVCRDYVPNQNGTPVTLAAGATDTVTVPYSLQSGWVEEKVKLVVYLQNMTLQGDTLATYQGLTGGVLSFTGVEESKLLAARDLRVSVSPNPCRTGCEFTLSGAAAHGARITVYTPDGRLVSSLQTAANRASWSRAGVSRGIYLYRINAGTATAEGKLVVAD
ncbi:MAG: T9SS type A sorting domain-containing protein [candidate division WOR-3 bacterium]|nr:T9SS type A sorting domain-containing protein [candidate division WOR-3 bacterium]